MIRIWILLLSILMVYEVSAADTVSVDTALENIKSNIDQEWKDIANKSLEIAIGSIKDKYHALIQIKQKKGNYDAETDLAVDEFGEVNFSNTALRIFVSTSMSLELLKYYQKQAKYYDGVLVLNGLPEGSWQELSQIVAHMCEINSDGSIRDSGCGLLIDDEAFREFDIKSVPSFVLSKNEGMIGDQVSFDKVSGNIGIKRALEIIANSGELKLEARKWLGKKF